MSSWLDEKYINLLAPRLRNFKRKSSTLWNFSCPICGDSHKDKLKARGYFYPKQGKILFHCHNCGATSSIQKFLKGQDPYLYSQYQLEKFGEKEPKEDFSKFTQPPVFKASMVDIPLPSIKSLSKKSIPYSYLKDRLVSEELYNDIYYAEDFSSFVKEIFPTHEKIPYKESRIVFPLRDFDNKLLGVQGRALGDNKVRYMTVKADSNAPKIYGLNTVDISKTIYVVEGIIDSLFLFNGIAALDGSLWNVTSHVPVDNCVFIPDKDVRNKQVMRNAEKLINRGVKVCMLPHDFPGKDLNEAIINGLTKKVVQHIIDKNTYSGIMAKMEFGRWSRI